MRVRSMNEAGLYGVAAGPSAAVTSTSITATTVGDGGLATNDVVRFLGPTAVASDPVTGNFWVFDGEHSLAVLRAELCQQHVAAFSCEEAS